ncbi:MAG: hypothetical protein A2698_01940 [Candidatus Levybacteria bacterium RIFCSPHIGHO2_01_FULL_42_15]|nr:MAG: hypothetical protein A2698_01940 [Candidatus Levybacteria bacterium RIFCSPHIGHO2_01_FULL_42_15]OGH41997.1 MAG: hypothetical protein A3B53_00620 [Candidatus Levybacteria bacterium RIFCSPLOWO2_01_FULL_42_15]
MQKNKILLSTGSILWMNVKDAIAFAHDTGFDGIELVPTKKVVTDFLNQPLDSLSYITSIKSLHQNWRFDAGLDKEYGINLMPSLLALTIRLIFFPKVTISEKYLSNISKFLNIPVVVHSINQKWTRDKDGKEFAGGILYEIFNIKNQNKATIKKWLYDKKHNVVVDTRDDQSLVWAKNQGFKDWTDFWNWIGLKKIGNVQLTLIGTKGIKKILNHKKSLAETQLLWLRKHKWKGSVTVEVNPLTLCVLNKGNLKTGLKTIASFVQQTLGERKNWST